MNQLDSFILATFDFGERTANFNWTIFSTDTSKDGLAAVLALDLGIFQIGIT